MVFQVVLVGYAGTNVIKKQPLQGEHALGEALLSPHTHQLGCQVQATVLTTERKIVICNRDEPSSALLRQGKMRR